MATLPNADAALPAFGFVTMHRQPLADGVAQEADWLAASAALGQASAHLWTAPAGIVVPRRHTWLPGWATAAADQRHGEVQVRASGGGLVPQGPGVWNLSLAWPAPAAVPTDTDTLYRGLCSALSAALARLGVAASPQPVAGSFCDGRFNLAVQGRKLVGTAQAWRRVAGVPMVLAHAVIVVSADPQALTARANAFEQALGTATRYRAEALTSVAACITPAGTCAARADATDTAANTAAITVANTAVEARVLSALAQQFARVAPPRVHHDREIEHGAA